MVIKSQKDFASGLLFTVVGGSFAIGATNYDMGTAARMGPGYFPIMLGVILALLGLIITFQSLGKTEKPGEQLGSIAWRPLFFVIGANVLFGVLLGGLPSIGLPPMGLMLSICVLVLVSSMASQEFRLRPTLVLAAILATGSYLVFIVLLGLPFEVWPDFISA